jgi:Transposase DNA-binding/Transposase Tn5 dimerisation domain
MDQMEFDLKDTFSFEKEFRVVQFGDKRLDKRFRSVMDDLSKRPTAAIPTACGEWTKVMGAYRMLGNDKITSSEIMRAHREELLKRVNKCARVLCIQDTTGLSFGTHQAVDELGSLAQGKYGSKGKGLFCHTTLVINDQGLPLGVMEQIVWSRAQLNIGDDLFYSEQEKWKMSLDQVIQASKQSPETQFIMTGDRENDFNDFILRAMNNKIGFVIRAKTTRVSDSHDKPILELLKSQEPIEKLVIDIKHESPRAGSRNGKTKEKREARKAHLNVCAGTFKLRLQKCFTQEEIPEEFRINAVLVYEPNPPKTEEPILWLLFTTLPIDNPDMVKDVVEIYRLRWQIEVFHKIMKSGCKIEECRLESIAKLKRFITIKSIIAWRILHLVEAARNRPEENCTAILKNHEWKALYLKLHRGKPLPKKPPTMKQALVLVARLGGFLARKCDGDPGPIVLWRGWQRLQDYAEMLTITDSCGFTNTCV